MMINRWSKEAVKQFLKEVDHDFPVPVSHKTDIDQLVNKYCEKATLCCESSEGRILAMVSGYTENTVDQIGYISLVATVKGARRKGLSSRLIQEFLTLAKQKGLKGVHVYTHKTNLGAIAMYNKLGFLRYYPKDESRPNDIHFYYQF